MLDLTAATGCSPEVLQGEHPTFELMGVRLDLLDTTQLVDRVFGDLDDDRGGWIVTPNVDILRRLHAEADLARLAEGATLAIIDGAPLEWACRLSSRRPIERIPGSAMPWLFGPEAVRHGRRMLLLGGKPQAAQDACSNLRAAFPGLEVSYYYPEYGFEDNPLEWEAMVTALRDSQADIVFVGLGFPKQERTIARLRSESPETWFIGCGAAIDFVARAVPRAPEWMQQAGLEWSYRMMVEPRRLGRRYLVHDLPFALRLLTRAVVQRLIGGLLLASRRNTALWPWSR